MSKIAAYAFIVLVGSNYLDYYSTGFPLYSSFILASLGVVVFAFLAQEILDSYRHIAIQNFLSPSIILWVLFLSSSMLFMWLSGRVFQRGVWISNACVVLVFVVGTLVGLDRKMQPGVMYGALTVVLIGVATNLFEFFVQNNMWSISPGRSGGFYVNPNISAGNIVAYSIVYFAFRDRYLKPYDYVVLAIVFSGIFVTFSRTGYLLFVLTTFMLFLSRSGFEVNAKSILQFGMVIFVVAGLMWVFVVAILPQMQVSKDTARRLASVTDATLGQDYSEERSEIAGDAWNLFLQSPLTGAGVRTSVEMQRGPHNMYVALALDFGVLGLVAYVALIVRLFWSGFRKIGDAYEGWLVVIMTSWLAAFSLASHNILYDAASMLALSISVALASAAPVWKRRHVKTARVSTV